MLLLSGPFPERSGVTFMPCLKAKTMKPTKSDPQRMAMVSCTVAAPRQLASASSDNCRGCCSVWVWSVRWVGYAPVKQ
ncbi:hypothetical protein ABIE85_001504 [Bradyrhizobium diazoefficiens]